jgi:hypothetical protein
MRLIELRRAGRIEQIAPVRDCEVPQLAERASDSLAMAASDKAGRRRQLSVIDDDADAIAFGTNQLKSHRPSNRRCEINRIKQLACRSAAAPPILASGRSGGKQAMVLT